MQWYLEALSKYAQFSGRSRRREYWLFSLFNALAYVALLFVDIAIATEAGGAGILSTLYILATAIPGLAVTVRRLHDTGRSGWWIFINFVPLIGFFVLLFFMVQDSDAGSNEYGPSPKYSGMAYS